jgi:hypothetical protein
MFNPAKLRYSHAFQRESWKRSMQTRHMFDTVIIIGIVALFMVQIINFVGRMNDTLSKA